MLDGSKYVDRVPETVALVALGPSSLDYIHRCDKMGDRRKLFDETWTLNTYISIIQADRIFHMDDVRMQEIRAKAGNKRIENMLEAMARFEGTIYTSIANPGYPSLVEFPLKEVLAFYKSAYFNSTLSYAIAFAGWIGVKKLTIFGADYTWPNIHQAEAGRACAEYWLGRYHGLGYEFDIAPQSTLCDMRDRTMKGTELYGYDGVNFDWEPTEAGVKLMMKERPLPTAEEIEKRYNHEPIDRSTQHVPVLMDMQ